ncbi:MFS transporter [Pseudomonas sp. TH39(2020)]|uniref:MFS transporter n=1 Tax=Pseudomonas sp. TH39(2020) TaxID=2796349 RepID=UPI001913693A|nr:MFS transporter [Pseudomonas sp. TH39(2020)]MBK5395919.1 MFS transporter [Pseudomonas sp. TH39(2020)]
MTLNSQLIKRPSRVMAAIGLLVLSLALRPAIISIGPILLDIRQAFNLSFTQASLLTSIPDLCMGALALASPLLAKRFGVNGTIIASLVLLAIGIVLRSQMESVSGLLLTTFIIGVGIAVAGSLIGGWIKEFYSDHAPMFMGIYSTGLSLGATAAAAGTDALTTATGSWRMGAGVWVILCITGIVSWLWLSKSHKSSTDRSQPQNRAKLPWRNPKAWLIALYFGCGQFLCYAILAWLAPSMLQMHTSTISPGYLLSAFTLIFTVANFLTGAIAGKSTDRRLLIGISSALTVVGVGGLACIESISPLVFIAFTAIGLGSAFTLGMTLPLDQTQTPQQANAWTVFTLFIGYLIAAAGPFGFGALRDLTGTFAAPYVLLTSVAVVMLVLTPLLRPTTEPQIAESSPALIPVGS